jgi:hypothetical protein
MRELTAFVCSVEWLFGRMQYRFKSDIALIADAENIQLNNILL